MRRSARSSPPPRCAASTLSRPSTPASPDNPSSSLPDQASTMGVSNYQTEQRREQPDAPVPVLDIASVHDRMHQEAFRVDEYVALLALDLLARIIARRVDRGPPFSALLTL